jgi:methylmalonyl-CoA/ethylmalonyl-CoA epimerase
MVRLGPVIQMAFVVKDIESVAAHWNRAIGVGPFYLLEHVGFGPSFFRGQPLRLDMSVAIAQWGEAQVELIMQHDQSTSIYTEFLAARGEGMQHVGVLCDSLDRELETLAARGVEPVQWGCTAKGMRFAYLKTDAHPGAMVELIESGPEVRAFFAMIRKGAAGWDGTRGLRRLS